MNNQISFIKDLLFPLSVAILSAIAAGFFSYFATYRLHKSSIQEEKKLKTIDLAETLRLEINKLTVILEKLKDDVEQLSYFSLKNIPVAQASVNGLKKLAERVILFREDLRREIIETIDTTSSLVDDLYVMENYQVTEETAMQQMTIEAEKEYRLFRVNLLNQGVYIKDGKADYFNKPKTKKKDENIDQKLETIEGIFKDLLANIDRSALDKLRAENEKRRNLLVTRILDAQTKLRAVVNSLKEY